MEKETEGAYKDQMSSTFNILGQIAPTAYRGDILQKMY